VESASSEKHFFFCESSETGGFQKEKIGNFSSIAVKKKLLKQGEAVVHGKRYRGGAISYKTMPSRSLRPAKKRES